MVPFCRLSLTNSSFIPSTIKEWNKLDSSIRNIDTVSGFKRSIRKNLGKTPKYLLYGTRKLNITLSQLRCSSSFLNYDLFKVNILSNPACSCGAPQEDTRHYFFNCPLYNDNRDTMLNNLQWLPEHIIINVNLLTRGSDELSEQENISLLKEVFKYIKGSRRFLIT